MLGGGWPQKPVWTGAEGGGNSERKVGKKGQCDILNLYIHIKFHTVIQCWDSPDGYHSLLLFLRSRVRIRLTAQCAHEMCVAERACG